MKVVKFFTSALLSSFLVVSATFATENGNVSAVKAAETSVRGQIVSVLSGISTSDKGVVYVSFQVTSNKSFELLSVNGNSSNLIGKVESALKRSKFEVPTVLNGKYLVKVRFVDQDEEVKSVSENTSSDATLNTRS